MEILFLRHGKTKGNLEKRYVGSTDEALLPEEREYITKLSRKDMDFGKTAFYVSPMKRCMETFSLFYPGQSYTIVPQFKECNFGDFEYKNYKELGKNPYYQKWIDSGGALAFPNGEDIESFKSRCIQGFLQSVQDAITNNRERIVFVVHGGTIMSVLSTFALEKKDYFFWQVGNLEGYRGILYQKNDTYVIRELEKIER